MRMQLAILHIYEPPLFSTPLFFPLATSEIDQRAMDLNNPIIYNLFSNDYDYRGELQYLIDIAIFAGSEHTAHVRVTDLIQDQPTSTRTYCGATGIRLTESALEAGASQPEDASANHELAQAGRARTEGAVLCGTGMWPWVDSAADPNVLRAFIKVFVEVLEWVRIGRHFLVPSGSKDRKLIALRFNSQEAAFACLPFIQGICGGPPDNPFPLFRDAEMIDTACLCSAIQRQLEVESNIHFLVDLSLHEFAHAEFDGCEMAPRDSLAIPDALPALEHHISSLLLKYMEQNSSCSKYQYNATLDSLVDSTERHNRAARLAGEATMPSRHEVFEGFVPDAALVQENAATTEHILSQSDNVDPDQCVVSEVNEAKDFDGDHLWWSKTEIPKRRMDLAEQARKDDLVAQNARQLLNTLRRKWPLVKQGLIMNGVLTASSVEPEPEPTHTLVPHSGDSTAESPTPVKCASDTVSRSALDDDQTPQAQVPVVQEEREEQCTETTSSGSSQISTKSTSEWPEPHSDKELQKALSEILSGSTHPRTRSQTSQSSYDGAACKKVVQDYFVFGIDAVNAALSKCTHSKEVIAVLVMGMEEHTECRLLDGLYDCILAHAARLPSLKLAVMPKGTLKLFPREKMRRRIAEDAVVLIKDGKDQVLHSLKTHTQRIVS